MVVGAGHAGCEAALASARLGRRVTVISLKRDDIARLSCNPAIGGLAKGNLVREIDALGGAMAKVTDATSVQFRHLNTRKGLAVQASRAQVDIALYPTKMAEILLSHPNVSFIEGEVAEIRTQNGRVCGVDLANGTQIAATAVILTTGTFLSAIMHCGPDTKEGGRIGDTAAHRLSTCLVGMGLRLGRLKTGTTPRLKSNSIDWDRLCVQPDIIDGGHFSFDPPPNQLQQLNCHIAYTNTDTHEIIRASLHRSPIYSGQISGRGPRYCPSIEDKIVRFAHRDQHQLFLEPEGLNSNRVYVNGLSTSLPEEVQIKLVRSIEGLERAEILQYGYAVEYDYSDPRDLDEGLQHQSIPGLFLAGQINGTSGYEEAAAQGLIAGASAALGEPFVLGRDEAYIGVLIDDLITKGVGGEPYRMFSSRAEHRLLLREDNADRRLMPKANRVGLIDEATWTRFQTKMNEIDHARTWCDARVLTPDLDTVAHFTKIGVKPIRDKTTVAQLIRRPEIQWDTISSLFPDAPAVSDISAQQVVTDIKYAGYLKREEYRAARTRRMASIRLKPDMDYQIPGISSEIVEKLTFARPLTLGAAARLPGVTPAAIDVLAMHLVKGSSTSNRATTEAKNNQ